MRTRPPTRDELEPIEIASQDELTALQTQRIKWTIHHAYRHVAIYKQKYDDVGVHPDDFRELSDLSKFPFTTKDDLRQAYPFGMFAVPREQLVRVHTSSGTTGNPTVVGYTKQDIETWTSLIARSIRAAGGRTGDILHNAYGYGLFTGGLGFHYGAELLGCTTIPISTGMTERQVKLIQDFKPDIISATPTYMLTIGDEFDRQGLDTRKSSLRIGLHGAEPWTESMRREIEDRFEMDALNTYGLSEILGPGVASECIETKDGLTIWEDHFYPEIIDPTSGNTLQDGEVGELLFTTLTKQALPLIRFRTRDLTQLLPPSARSMRRCDRINGRSDDMIIIRGVNVFPSQIEELILQQNELSPHYLLELRQINRMNDLTVLVEIRKSFSLAGDSILEKAGQILQSRIKSTIGINTTVKVVPEGSIDRSMGKAKRIIDFRGSA